MRDHASLNTTEVTWKVGRTAPEHVGNFDAPGAGDVEKPAMSDLLDVHLLPAAAYIVVNGGTSLYQCGTRPGSADREYGIGLEFREPPLNAHSSTAASGPFPTIEFRASSANRSIAPPRGTPKARECRRPAS